MGSSVKICVGNEPKCQQSEMCSQEGKLHFRLNMEASADDEEDQPVEAGRRRTVDFVYDPDEDTPDAIAGEMAENFDLSSTDRDICAAALKEWLAKEAPNSHGD